MITKGLVKRADVAMKAYKKIAGTDESNLRDLLTDLFHWADAHGEDLGRVLQAARKNYEYERAKDS